MTVAHKSNERIANWMTSAVIGLVVYLAGFVFLQIIFNFVSYPPLWLVSAFLIIYSPLIWLIELFV